MKIYTGNAYGEKLNKVEDNEMGIMIASSATFKPSKEFSKVSCALDNGAFQCWRRGFPFMEKYFLLTLEKCYEVGISLDFIVIPDIVAGGIASLDFSMLWKDRLVGSKNLALAVQDGMETTNIDHTHIDRCSHIFVGGTEKWKWNTVLEWAAFAHRNKIKIHVGRVGTANHLEFCEHLKIDSVDSTSFARNESWHIVKNLKNNKTLEFGE